MTMDNGQLTTRCAGDIKYLTADNITTVHGFTTRLGGVSPAPFDSLNLSMHRGDDAANVEKNFSFLASGLGFDLNKLVMTHQTHTDIVRVVTDRDAQGLDHHTYPECDALITNTPGVALWVFTADCTPILLHDPVTGAVGAVHAGWRGTASGIVKNTVEAMVNRFGCDPKNIHAAIGPNIGPCCFETDRDVPDAMVAALGEEALSHIRPSGNKYYVNLKTLNALWLHRCGVRSIAISSDCTACQPRRFWSHRKVGKNRGSQGAVIVCKEATL